MLSETLNFHTTFACKHTQITLHRHRLSGKLSVWKNCLLVGIWLLHNFRFAHQHVWHSSKQENQSFCISSSRKGIQITTSVTISKEVTPSQRLPPQLQRHDWPTAERGICVQLKTDKYLTQKEGIILADVCHTQTYISWYFPDNNVLPISWDSTTNWSVFAVISLTDCNISQHTNMHSKAWFS